MKRFCLHAYLLEGTLGFGIAVGSADAHDADLDLFQIHYGSTSMLKVFFQLSRSSASEASTATFPFNPCMSSFSSLVTLPISAQALLFIKSSNAYLSWPATSMRNRLLDSENNTKSLRIKALPGTLHKSSSKPVSYT